MTLITAHDIRSAWILGQEIALIDVRDEADFAQGHPLFAAQISLSRIDVEAHWRIPRRDVLLVVYDDGEGLAQSAADKFADLGYEQIRLLKGGLQGWQEAGFELFEDVNSYAKAFGELVEHRRHTPSLTSPEVKALIDAKANVVVLDARRFDEYNTMSIPTGISVPGAELVLNAQALAPDPETTIIVNCAGRTRSIIGTQSLINAGIPNKVVALRNGTIGWTLAGQELDKGQTRKGFQSPPETQETRNLARNVAYRAGVKRITLSDLKLLEQDTGRTLYRFDVRQKDSFEAGHIAGFANVPGGQLVQETDHYVPVRGARIVLSDNIGARADMSASWLAQMGWEVYVLDGGFDGPLVTGPDGAPPPRGPEGRYRRPYEGTENPVAAMQAYLDWEYGLVGQLARDASHGFYVI
ncbi:rhodanese-like domain-containing protein [Asticcacaulis endophyticus]|uniref:Thiosulfate sulfurtransferase n=1 Tax=Asticcacaulis endophyticus TaxID=1395890 RepID=A0A918Q1U1_9CAUL|nr:rhodanese-like domain-containing protein [Asticcacaulis endophyticus]GGZ30908.1 thiosulfate sulfurtransferase [Asticcacaulis endophyticus]